MAFNVGNEKKDIFSKLKSMGPAKRVDFFRSSQSQGGASVFSFLTPAEFAELFPKYYLKSLPDIAGFQKALSSKKSLGGEGQTYGPHGEAGGNRTANVATGEKVTNTVRAKEIYDYIRSKGVDHVHAVGIVNNMKYESNFNSGAMGDGDTSGGLFQHHASRFTAMKNYVGEGWQTNWKKQIDFALTEGEMKTYLGKNYANATDASKEFTLGFERPANKESVSAYRAGTAEGYGTAMSGGGGEAAGGQTSGGGYEVTSSGFIVPKDKGLYSPGNEEQCATLAKAMNPNIGRSSSWTVVPGEIKPGVTVATMRYNLPGGDRTGAGYHTGVAMSAPDAAGNFLLLEQFSGRKPQVRQVNANAYSGGSMGGTTQFGIIQSNGKVHNEQSTEALKYGAGLASEEQKAIINGNLDAVTKGGSTGPQTGTGEVSVNPQTTAGTPGPQSNLQQQDQVKSIQTATIGDMMRFVGDLAGFFNRGEGLGDAPQHRDDIGIMSRKFESGKRGVFTVSTGRKDPGGVSYGEHQLSSKAGTMARFLASAEGKPYAQQFAGLTPGTPKFSKVYKQVAAQNPEAFAKSQHSFITRVNYQPVYEHAKKLGFNVEDPRVQEALYSMSIQHGGAKRIVSKSKAAASLSPEAQVSSLYQHRHEYTMRHHQNFSKRYAAEKKDILAMDINKYMPEPKQSQYARVKEMGPTAPVEQKIQTASAPTATVEPPKKTRAEQLYGAAKEYFGGTTSSAQEGRDSYGQVAERMRHLKADPVQKMQPDLPPGVFTAPPDLSNQLMQTEPDRQSMMMQQVPSEKPQGQVNIDPFLDRKNPEFPSPSLERHAFAIRGLNPSTGANFMHFGNGLGSS